MDPDRVAFHLYVWSKWMHAEFSSHLQYRRAASGMGFSGSCDFDDMCESADRCCAAATDAVIDALPHSERDAIHVRHLGARWRYFDPIESAYASACVAIGKGLTKRGVV
jgi:hypothetical protein